MGKIFQRDEYNRRLKPATATATATAIAKTLQSKGDPCMHITIKLIYYCYIVYQLINYQ